MNINYRRSEALVSVFCRYSILANGTLIVRRVDDSDVGIYKCVGVGRTGPVQTYAAELLLACKSNIASINPLVTLRSVEKEPKPSLLCWTVNNQQYIASDRFRMQYHFVKTRARFFGLRLKTRLLN